MLTHSEIKEHMTAQFGLAAVFLRLLDKFYWLGLLYGGLWIVRHFLPHWFQ